MLAPGLLTLEYLRWWRYSLCAVDRLVIDFCSARHTSRIQGVIPPAHLQSKDGYVGRCQCAANDALRGSA